ncbi:hypothetical protein N185_10715 [Sinorhizobium sp. GW3]|nr:hypothetical protein N185_10715 [Sinorhizobium sp. GW3]
MPRFLRDDDPSDQAKSRLSSNIKIHTEAHLRALQNHLVILHFQPKITPARILESMTRYRSDAFHRESKFVVS